MTATDPRARQLAEAVHGLARQKATTLPAWPDLPLSEREKVTAEARLWLRAAVDAGLVPPATDRATILREAADDLATAFGDPTAKHIGILAASYLRRRAREAEVAPTTEAQPEAEPETPLEKRLRFSERRNDELRTECLRRGKTVAERGEKIRELEKQLDEVRSQLGAEILRAGQAEAELRRMADEAQQPEPTTADKAAALGMADAEYRAHSHRAAVDAIRAAIPGLYATVGLRVEDVLADAPAAWVRQPDTETQDACTCASAGDAFVPAGHYRDCPAAAPEPHPTEADVAHAMAVLDRFQGRTTAGGAGGVADETADETGEGEATS